MMKTVIEQILSSFKTIGKKKNNLLITKLNKLKKYLKDLDINEQFILDNNFMTEIEQIQCLEQITFKDQYDFNAYLKFIHRLKNKMKQYEKDGKTGVLKRKKQQEEELQLQTIDMETRLKMIENSAIRKVIRDNIESADKHEFSKHEKRCNLQLDIQLINERKKETMNNINLEHLKNQLDKEIYKMDNVKEFLLLMTNQKILNPFYGQSFLLLGPPGIGKTALLQQYSELVGMQFIFISLAGLKDPQFLKGHGFTYIGSQPGIIATEIVRKNSNQCLFLFDELDKCSLQIQDILIQITDYQQNKIFQDEYLEIPMDLSKCIFMFTANNEQTISTILQNRLHKIMLNDYSTEEKFHIIKSFSIKKISMKIYGSINILIPDDVIKFIIQNTEEKGMRQVEKQIEQICLYYSMEKKDITLEYVKNKIGQMYKKKEPPFGMYV